MVRIIPPLATPVIYYPHGKKSDEPVGCLVSQINASGVLCLNKINRGGGEVMTVKGVRHIDDPQIKNNPEYARTNGGWDYHPWFPPPQRVIDSLEETIDFETQKLNDEEDFRVMELHEEGKSSSEIAAAMGDNWSYQKVNASLKKAEPCLT